MNAGQLQHLDLMEFTQGDTPGNTVRAAWPVYRDTGAVDTAVVYIEPEPGMHLPRHSDSAEELLVVLDGEIEAVIGDEHARLSKGGIARVPAMVPHAAVNVGERVARIAGVFGSNTIVSIFDSAFDQTGGRVVGTPPPEQAEAPVPAVA